jgi:hypothetical protein
VVTKHTDFSFSVSLNPPFSCSARNLSYFLRGGGGAPFLTLAANRDGYLEAGSDLEGLHSFVVRESFGGWVVMLRLHFCYLLVVINFLGLLSYTARM